MLFSTLSKRLAILNLLDVPVEITLSLYFLCSRKATGDSDGADSLSHFDTHTRIGQVLLLLLLPGGQQQQRQHTQ